MADFSRPELVLNETSLNFVLQQTARKREDLIRALKELADSIHDDPIGKEQDMTGRDLSVRVIRTWEITFWNDWENELRIVRILNT